MTTAYLDNSATTRPFPEAVRAMSESMLESYYNPSSMYRPAIDVDNKLTALRKRILRLLPGAVGDIYFTSGGTESNNLAILGAAARFHGPSTVICSAVEHPSVLEPVRALSSQGIEVRIAPVDSRGMLDLPAFQSLLDSTVKLVSIMHVNNEVGAIQPIRQIAALLDADCPQALLHVDGVQAFLREDFPSPRIDMYTLSGHKLHAPKGVGALYVKKGTRLSPRQLGGGQERQLRSGTENVPGIIGLSAAIEQYSRLGGLPERHARLLALKRRLWEGLHSSIPECILNGPDLDTAAPHILNAAFPGVRGEVLLHALEGKGVYVSTGSACSSRKAHVSPILLAMGQTAAQAECALRFSLSPLTTDAEIELAITAAAENYALLKAFVRR